MCCISFIIAFGVGEIWGFGWLLVKLITHVLGILENVAVKFPVVNGQLFDVYTREGKKLNI